LDLDVEEVGGISIGQLDFQIGQKLGLADLIII
jgi:hypothetical protein